MWTQLPPEKGHTHLTDNDNYIYADVKLIFSIVDNPLIIEEKPTAVVQPMVRQDNNDEIEDRNADDNNDNYFADHDDELEDIDIDSDADDDDNDDNEYVINILTQMRDAIDVVISHLTHLTNLTGLTCFYKTTVFLHLYM